MARARSYTYWHAPLRASMILQEGAWTDDDDYKLGGYYASQMQKDQFVRLSGDWTVARMLSASENVIGKLISDPIGGDHSTNGRYGTILLFGTTIEEVEIKSGSDTIAIGASVMPATGTGSEDKGYFTLDTVSNGTCALVAYATASAVGTKIPVLFGYEAF